MAHHINTITCPQHRRERGRERAKHLERSGEVVTARRKKQQGNRIKGVEEVNKDVKGREGERENKGLRARKGKKRCLGSHTKKQTYNSLSVSLSLDSKPNRSSN